MQLRRLVLQDFRNIARADLVLQGGRQFLVGANGQGKTNLLEAAGLVTALRSFRTADARLLPRAGCAEGSVAWEVEHERLGEVRVVLRLRPAGKELHWGQEKIVRLADHLGTFPTVVFSSQDLALVRGGPAERRRWVDLVLSAMDGDYFRALQDYMRALAGRNALLKRERGGAFGRGAGGDRGAAATGGAAAPEAGGLRGGGAFPAFERILARAGSELIVRRMEGLGELSARFGEAYARLAGGFEAASLSYEPAGGMGGGGSGGEGARVPAEAAAAALLERLEAGRARDVAVGSTLTGPHRDDLGFRVGGSDARSFASEGQQRSVVLALRLAQCAWFQARSGIRPVLLADDVLGELDPARRTRFWESLDPACQVIATGTQRAGIGESGWQVFQVEAGGIRADRLPIS